MPKQINVKLGFQADTAQAKKQIQDLQHSLDNLMSNSIKNNATNGFSQQISDAQQSVIKLKSALNNSLNTDTGRLDLSKFNQQLINSDLTLSKLAKDMTAMGSDGQKAFLNLANSIVTAQKPMVESNRLLDSMWTALKNTARWQLSSSILHGFVGSLQGAYGYAQDLNKSLNSIRIVSGQSADQMAQFAEQANKSAQALSTSTLAYTDAALIFYQQGLRGEEVNQRVDTVLKLSNVTGESAEDVSSYMTAIWNNFDDGSASLESYADKITALGAATASSSEEIANGMQQFAAVANTVGLSYDYAASALATVVAQTRQSESTVGNAFRTIFSRLQGLKLGDTLEDGTDLNKYSAALETVGVNIKEQNGDLKDMDTILNEIGAKWNTLAKDQQMALAQTVGGVRQYANLIALFDNWDQFQENLLVSQNAEGTLQEQADIYAESWEAARKRVQAAWQAIYQDLINDKFFIGLLDNIEKVLSGVDRLIKAIGGIPGVLSGLGAIVTTVFGKQLTSGLQNAQLQLSKVLKPSGDNRTYAEIIADKQADQALNEAIENRKKMGASFDTNVEDLTLKNLQDQLILNKQLRNLKQEGKDIDVERYQAEIKITEELAKQAQELLKAKNEAASKSRKVKSGLLDKMSDAGTDKSSSAYIQAQGVLSGTGVLGEQFSKSVDAVAKMPIDQQSQAVNVLIERFFKFREAVGWSTADVREFINTQVELSSATKNSNDSIAMVDGTIANLRKELGLTEREFKNFTAKISDKDLFNQQDKSRIGSWEKVIQRRQTSNVQLEQKNVDLTEHKLALEKQLTDLAVKQSDEQSKIADWLNDANTLREEGDAQSAAEFELEAQKLQQELDNSELTKQILDTKRQINETEAQIVKNQEQQEQNLADIEERSNKINNLYQEKIGDISALPEAIQSEKDLPFFLNPKFGDNLMRVTQGITQITSALTALGTIWDTLNNPDLSSWEKFTQILSSLVIAIPMVVAGFNALTSEQSIATIKTIALAIANQKLAVSEAEVAAATLSVQASLGIIGLAIGAVVGAVWLLKKAWDEIKALTPQGQLDAANKKLEEQQEKLKEVTEAYNNLTSAINNYKNAQEQLNAEDSDLSDLDRKKLIADTNAEIYEALKNTENWKSVIGQLHYDENGLINLTEEQQNALKNDQYRVQLLEQQKELEAEIAAVRAERTVNDVDFESIGPRIWSPNMHGEPEDVTAQTWSKLADAGITDIDSLLSYTENSRGQLKLSQILDATGQELQNVINAIIEISNGDKSQIEALESYLQKRYDNVVKEQLLVEQQARQGLGDQLNKYDESSQNSLIEQYAGLKPEDQRSLDESIAKGKTLDEAFKAVGISLNDLHLKLKEVEEDVEGVGHQIKTNINAEDLNNFKGKTEDLEKEVQTLSEFLKDNTDKFKELSEHIKECDAVADAVAYSFIRFDDAMQDVGANYESWKEALKSKDVLELNKAVKELTKTYGNLLDIDGSQLSDDFLQSSKNLELMNKVLTGTEEEAVAAYNELQKIATIDLAEQLNAKMGLQLDTEAFSAAYDEVVSWIDAMKLVAGDDIEVGDANYDNLVNSLNSMLALIGNDVDAAQEMLKGMGFSAELENIPAETTDTENKTDMNATWEQSSSGDFIGMYTDSGSEQNGVKWKAQHAGKATAWNVKYTPGQTSTTQDKKVTNVQGLKIKSGSTLHYIGGGSPKVKNSPVRRANAASPGSGGKKGGGGGGGSAKKLEVKEHVKDEDRYHDIKERIDDLNKSTDRLGKTKDRVYGKSKLKYINDEIEALEKQVELTDEYIAEIKKYLALDLSNLKGINMGAVFDENGMLTNYEQVLANITATYNKAIDEYNASAQEEADKEILEKAQKTYEENKKILKQYEDTYNLLQEEVDKRIDQINAIYDAKLAKIDWQVKLQLDFDDKDRELLQWIFDNMGEGADRAADRIANLNEQMKTFDQDWETYRNGIKEIFSQHGIDLDFDNLNADQLVLQLQEFMRNEQLASELTEKEAEQLRGYLSGLMTTYTSMRDTANEVHEILANSISAMADEFDKNNRKIEQAGEIMKHYANIVDLTGRKLLKLSSSELKKMSQQIVNNAKDALGAAKAEMEEWRAQMEEAQMLMLKYQLEGDEQSYEYWKEHFEQLEELYTDATENYYSAWENALEAANDAFEKSIDLMKEDYENAFGSMDLTWMAEQFKTQQELNELYLPDYKKYHELNASVRKLNKSLQDTNNTLIKGKMNDLLDEINAKMAAGVKISEYEAGIIERRIALLQAEAQLRDAQQAKSAVRMTRDNEGNFSYTYTADQDVIGEAEENYAEAVYDYQDYMVSMSNDLQSKWLEWNQYFAEREAEILAKYKEGTEEYNQAMAALAEEREAKLSWLTDQMGVLFDEQKRFRDNDWADIENIVQMKLLSDEDLITSFDRTVLSAITGYDTLTELMDAGEMAWENMLIDAEDALQTWQDNCYTIYEEAGTTVDDFAAKTEADMESVAEDSQKAKEAIYDMVNNEENGMKKALEDAKTAAKDFDDAYGKYMTNIRNATQNTIAALNDMLKKLNETYQAQVKLAQQAKETSAAVAAANNAAASSPSSGGTPSGTGNRSSTPSSNPNPQPPPGGGNTTVAAGNHGVKSGTKILKKGLATFKAAEDWAAAYQKKHPLEVLSVFNSGGYTGDWAGNLGKIAMLHKKELVLNKDDTENMLKAVDYVRQITQMAGAQSLFKNNVDYNKVNTIGAMGGELQQNVHIDASFPNVQSHTEIELALNNLINSATQYVNRK